MILCIGPTPAAQRAMVFRQLHLDTVNRAVETADGVAGKSVNVAKVLRALGETPIATGFLGGVHGESVRTALAARGVVLDFVSVAAPTRQCITVIDQAGGTITELVEESRPVGEADYERLRSVVRKRVGGCRAVIVSGTMTPRGPVGFYRECVELGHGAGALTVLDVKGDPLLEALKVRPGLVKPNRPELAATVGRELGDERDVMRAMREMGERGAQRVVVTAGREPSLAFDGKAFWRITPPVIRAVNPIGSGDAFTAALTWRLLRGDDLGAACRWGAAAGAANALNLHAGEVDPAEVRRLHELAVLERV